MTPRLAQAVDPVLLHMVELLDRIQSGQEPSPPDERVRVRALLDQAEAIAGAGAEWELSKYALVSWIDEMLVDTPWSGRDWWSNNVLEMETFNSRSCYERFYVKAQEASTLAQRGALEVYYVCVVMGFRGLYQDPEMSADFIRAQGLPPDLDTWAKQTALSIRLGQGRPHLDAPARQLRGAPPLRRRSGVVVAWMAAVLLATANIYYYFQL
jgi:type VI secretion system protein ImpK